MSIVNLGKTIFFGVFDILNNYGTSWKSNILESPPNIPTPTPAYRLPPLHPTPAYRIPCTPCFQTGLQLFWYYDPGAQSSMSEYYCLMARSGKKLCVGILLDIDAWTYLCYLPPSGGELHLRYSPISKIGYWASMGEKADATSCMTWLGEVYWLPCSVGLQFVSSLIAAIFRACK